MKALVFCSLFLFISNSYSFEQGIIFGQNTRMIFNLADNAQGISVTNASKIDYLLHTKVVNSNEDRTLNMDFIVTPELIPLKPESRNRLTIRRLGGDFPKDRESLLYLVGTFIPSGLIKGNRLELAYTVTMKLFVRPESLKTSDAVEESLKKIKVRYFERQIFIKNTSPYHLTFYDFVVDGTSVDLEKSKKMLIPFSEVCLGYFDEPKSVEWSLISDSGYETAKERIMFD